jgi:hypothetical protein
MLCSSLVIPTEGSSHEDEATEEPSIKHHSSLAEQPIPVRVAAWQEARGYVQYGKFKGY